MAKNSLLQSYLLFSFLLSFSTSLLVSNSHSDLSLSFYLPPSTLSAPKSQIQEPFLVLSPSLPPIFQIVISSSTRTQNRQFIIATPTWILTQSRHSASIQSHPACKSFSKDTSNQPSGTSHVDIMQGRPSQTQNGSKMCQLISLISGRSKVRVT
jgi:hypothetical protein